MGYIPEGAEWYLAEIVQEIKIKGERKNVVHINTILIHARSPEAAYKKAVKLGKKGETSYKNTDGKKVRIIFRGLHDLWVIHDELEHGSELTYSEKIGLSKKEVKQLISQKKALWVFAPRQAARRKPNYMPRSVMKQLREHFPDATDEDIYGDGSS